MAKGERARGVSGSEALDVREAWASALDGMYVGGRLRPSLQWRNTMANTNAGYRLARGKTVILASGLGGVGNAVELPKRLLVSSGIKEDPGFCAEYSFAEYELNARLSPELGINDVLELARNGAFGEPVRMGDLRDFTFNAEGIALAQTMTEAVHNLARSPVARFVAYLGSLSFDRQP